jgi:hypothetical protein
LFLKSILLEQAADKWREYGEQSLFLSSMALHELIVTISLILLSHEVCAEICDGRPATATQDALSDASFKM